MTLKNCLERAKVFKEQGKIEEAEFWKKRAMKKGYKPEPEVKPKAQDHKK